ncbi:RNA polymerase sigma factor [Psychroflexus sp. MES1-P1E]|jgi:RNA polymerase sigma factor (sigma-70 family)|uniref:RNA polymerase sigma factor n=1 Tax=Psychroflexus sp. MES1-P1E TaxID=2058320 RepID=UPI000C7AF8C0|nr:sigma-70 family RNA polymerase sigma factor [Psychroflexus sp. MES1-P1E]PKG43714.1 RNA polymerase subunit sigma [Psychroflexus sp. MES1-P1E]|tara:strand:- start:653 stop:1144 length:492 start_codon:yes stop_codon:yes gene_type:complete
MITEQEFTNIYNLHASKVHRLCLGYASGNNELAKEWHQETFIKVWKHRNSFKGKSSIDTWIYRIAVNVCLGDLRKSRKSITINEDLLSNSSYGDNKNDDEKNIKKMYHCIDQLNEQNKALILLGLENIPQTTIADTVGLAHGTLRTRLSRIRKSLLKCITNGK